jgi:hypothetical protein
MGRGVKFMALKKTYENQTGEVLNGYYRVREVHTQYEKDKDGPISLAAIFAVEAYDYDTGKPVLWSPTKTHPTWTAKECGTYNLTIPDMEPVQNLIIKAYDHLKTLPEFNGAEDC